MNLQRCTQWIVARAMGMLRPDARNSLAISLLLTAPDRPPRPIDHFDARRVVVLAPHADDESIGCGGVIALHARAGAQVRVAVMTDGALGDRRFARTDLPPAARALMRAELIRTRRDETIDACKALGAPNPVFFDAPDGALAPNPALVERLGSLLDACKPELIYLPFLMDQHEDHWQTNRIFNLALARCGPWQKALLVRGYEVWSPLVANRLVDITAVAAQKVAAVRSHASQLRDRDYQTAILGLNQYRAMHLEQTDGRLAEAFFECSAPGYQLLMASVAQRHASV